MDSQESGLSYEDVRKQRLEENKKRMQELGLANLSKNLSGDIAATKTTPQPRQVKPRMPKEFIELRRSSRVASNPAPDYREVDADSSLGRRSHGPYSSRASSLLNRKYASDEARLDAALQAETIMKELPKSNPSFVKPMLQSHVTGGFWLGLPSFFCKTYLPKKDEKIVLENEKGDEWETVFLANKAGLSGGWRGFSLDHGLVDGDALVFELVEQWRFKVHIVRASEEAQEEDDTKEETDEKESEALVPSKRKGDTGSSQKGKQKKKQAIKESELRYSIKAIAKRKQTMKEPESGSEESEKETEKSTKKDPSKKKCTKRKSRTDDVEDLFEIVEDDTLELNNINQITSFLRAEKPRFGRGSKKPMASCGDGISVC
eukprot:c7136_g1_i1 orf=154-1278(+)